MVGVGAKARRAAIGGTRVERSAGISEETKVTTTPTISETMTVRDSITRPVVGRSIPIASKRALSRSAMRKPPTIPMIAPTQPDHDRLDQDRAEDLAPRGAERAQHPELGDPLGDRDREGVEDQEGADEDGDEAEDQQEGRAGS